MAAIKDGTSNTIAMSEHVVSTQVNRRTHGNYVQNVPISGNNPQAECLIYKGAGGMIANTAPEIGQIRGINYAWGAIQCSGFNTVLPPNSIGCTAGQSEWGEEAILPPDSYHPGGVNALIADGSTRFISETIDSGNVSAPEPSKQNPPNGRSPYGVWGALGSKSGGEPPGEF